MKLRPYVIGQFWDGLLGTVLSVGKNSCAIAWNDNTPTNLRFQDIRDDFFYGITDIFCE